ncbi:hypothetical protein NQZ68_026427, partial [Dissostichus eleginoides]
MKREREPDEYQQGYQPEICGCRTNWGSQICDQLSKSISSLHRGPLSIKTRVL